MSLYYWLRSKWRLTGMWLIERTTAGRLLQSHAWLEGWDEGRRIEVRACPDDFNPYASLKRNRRA